MTFCRANGGKSWAGTAGLLGHRPEGIVDEQAATYGVDHPVGVSCEIAIAPICCRLCVRSISRREIGRLPKVQGCIGCRCFEIESLVRSDKARLPASTGALPLPADGRSLDRKLPSALKIAGLPVVNWLIAE